MGPEPSPRPSRCLAIGIIDKRRGVIATLCTSGALRKKYYGHPQCFRKILNVSRHLRKSLEFVTMLIFDFTLSN